MRTARVNVSIDTPHLDDAIRFYGEVFGFAETARPLPHMAVLDGGNISICVHEKAAGTPSSQGSTDSRRYDRHWTPVHLDFHVAEFRDCLAAIEAGNGKIERLFDSPRSIAFCSDPFGNGFCVLGVT